MGNHPQTLSGHTASIAKCNKAQIKRFPYEPFERSELDKDQIALFDRFLKYEIVERAEEPEWHKEKPAKWKLKDWFIDSFEEKFGNVTMTECGKSTGVKCIEAGEVYTCSVDDDICDCRFGREEAKRVMSGH